jgi:hypothetical protein
MFARSSRWSSTRVEQRLRLSEFERGEEAGGAKMGNDSRNAGSAAAKIGGACTVNKKRYGEIGK